MRRDCRKGDALTILISHHRPARPQPQLAALLWLAPGLLLAGAMIGHMVEAVLR